MPVEQFEPIFSVRQVEDEAYLIVLSGKFWNELSEKTRMWIFSKSNRTYRSRDSLNFFTLAYTALPFLRRTTVFSFPEVPGWSETLIMGTFRC